MAFEACRGDLFPAVVFGNRDSLGMNGFQGMEGGCGVPVYGVADPVSGASTTEILMPVYGGANLGVEAVKCSSSQTYAVPALRKRPREAAVLLDTGGLGNSCGGGDFAALFRQQEVEIDRFVAQHTEKLRAEIESRRRRFSLRISVEAAVIKRLKAKEEEIEKIGKLNWALQERVKSLSLENQIWRDLARTNEATANALRCNLQQVLAQVHPGSGADDAESSCGSATAESPSRMCRSCRTQEASVLLLPCRHLCLCTVCGSSLQTCPVCNSPTTATVHVNLSS